MMPACTGLPPGELINNTTACEPSSSKAERKEVTTALEPARPSASISPLISITAVCAVDVLVLLAPRCKTTQDSTTKKTNQAKRNALRHCRARRCSFK